MPDNSTVSRLPPQLPVKQIATAAQALIDLLDALGGDPDIEDATGAEDEHVQLLETEEFGPGCKIADGGDVAWVEWHRMRGNQKHRANFTLGAEDAEDDDAAEEDDGGGDVVTEDEPAFDPLSRAIANAMGADGPGGGSLLDSDYEDGV